MFGRTVSNSNRKIALDALIWGRAANKEPLPGVTGWKRLKF